MQDTTHPQPPVAIRQAATVAVLADARDGLRVLLLRRAASHVFGADADVYPGGAVDAADHHEASADAAYRRAAIRECFEEAGLLVALTAEPAGSAADIAATRAALCAGEIDWRECCCRLALSFEADALVAFAHWTTPAGAPKRYATQFYAVAAPAGQIATADGEETTQAEWVLPSKALAEARAGQRLLMAPTRATLEQLVGFDSVATALAGLNGSAVAGDER